MLRSFPVDGDLDRTPTPRAKRRVGRALTSIRGLALPVPAQGRMKGQAVSAPASRGGWGRLGRLASRFSSSVWSRRPGASGRADLADEGNGQPALCGVLRNVRGRVGQAALPVAGDPVGCTARVLPLSFGRRLSRRRTLGVR